MNLVQAGCYDLVLAVDSSTLWEQTWHLSRHLLPTYEANHAHALDADVIAVDEQLPIRRVRLHRARHHRELEGREQ